MDCVSYGPYTGPQPTVAGAPVVVTPGGGTYSLTRTGATPLMNDNVFALACPSPANNAGAVGGFGPCSPPTTTTSTTIVTTTTTSTTTSTLPGGGQQLLTGKKLLLVDNPTDLSKRKVKLLSKDLAVGLGGGNGSGDDPTLAGASLRIVSTAGDTFDDTYSLPAGGWKYLGTAGANVGYKYLDKLQVNGPVRVAVVKSGRLVKTVGFGTGLQHTLVADPAPVGVVLSLGPRKYCMSFGGTTTFVTPKKFVALDAPGPGGCPP